MFQEILVSRVIPVITPEQLAVYGRWDCPEEYCDENSPPTVSLEYALIETFIDAATDQVETMAAQACLNEQVLLTFDFYPNTQDPRNFLQYELSYSYAITPWWWWGLPTKDSIELVRRPVIVPSYTDEAVAVTALSVANNIVSVDTTLNPPEDSVVILNGTAEGDVSNPTTTPSTTPFLNGVPLTVLTSNDTGFTASFPNFYQISETGAVTPQSYTNGSDTGTAQVWSNPLILTYNDQNGVQQIWNTNNYTVFANKVTLTVGNWWPLTDRRQDCIQITYWGGRGTEPSDCPSRLQLAIMFLANHFYQVRQIVTVEKTSEIGMTLCSILRPYKTYRIPR